MMTPPNIYVIGAQCTGKTTLVNALQSYFSEAPSRPETDRPAIIKEVARTVLQRWDFRADEIRSSPERCTALQRLIQRAQLDAEREALTEHSWFISDRSGVDPIVYAARYAGDSAAKTMVRSPEWTELKGRLRQGVIIVCEAGMDWLVDDGVRLLPQDRDEWLGIHQMFCSFLEGNALEYVVLPRTILDLGQRVSFITSQWDQAKAGAASKG